MYFKDKRVTLENLSTIFEGYSLDIQDEVRSMVLDNLDLSRWIDICKDNPYRLNQIRLATKEGVDPRFFSISSGSNLYELRRLLENGFNGKELLPYLGKGFYPDQWSMIFSWAKNGYLDKRLNLVRTPYKMWGYIDKGLRNNLPMWIFTNGNMYSDTYMQSVITIMSNGYMPEDFVKLPWKEDVLKLLAEFSYRRWYKSIVGFVYNFITYDFLLTLGELAKEGVIDTDLFVLGCDEDSGEHYYLYQSYHLEAILKCVIKNLDYSRLKDYDLSGSEVNLIVNELELNSKRSFKGRL